MLSPLNLISYDTQIMNVNITNNTVNLGAIIVFNEYMQ